MTNPSLAIDAQIVSDPAIHRGEPLLVGTSTTVRAIAELWNQGMAAEEIPLHLSHLKLQQVFAALYYYLSHRQEIDQFIAANHIPHEWTGRRFDPAHRAGPMMAKPSALRLYLDEDVDVLLGDLMAARGYDCLAALNAEHYELARHVIPVLARYDQAGWRNCVMYA